MLRVEELGFIRVEGGVPLGFRLRVFHWGRGFQVVSVEAEG